MNPQPSDLESDALPLRHGVRYTLTNYDLSTDGKPFVIFRFFFLEIKTSQNLEALDVAAWMQDSV